MKDKNTVRKDGSGSIMLWGNLSSGCGNLVNEKRFLFHFFPIVTASPDQKT